MTTNRYKDNRRPWIRTEIVPGDPASIKIVCDHELGGCGWGKKINIKREGFHKEFAAEMLMHRECGLVTRKQKQPVLRAV